MIIQDKAKAEALAARLFKGPTKKRVAIAEDGSVFILPKGKFAKTRERMKGRTFFEVDRGT